MICYRCLTCVEWFTLPLMLFFFVALYQKELVPHLSLSCKPILMRIMKHLPLLYFGSTNLLPFFEVLKDDNWQYFLLLITVQVVSGWTNDNLVVRYIFLLFACKEYNIRQRTLKFFTKIQLVEKDISKLQWHFLSYIILTSFFYWSYNSFFLLFYSQTWIA